MYLTVWDSRPACTVTALQPGIQYGGSGLSKMAVSSCLNLLHLPLYLKHISHFRCKSQFHALAYNFMLYVG